MTDALEHRFPCETCGSDLRYAPGTDHLICDHCGATLEILSQSTWRGQSLRELDFRTAVAEEIHEITFDLLIIGIVVHALFHVWRHFRLKDNALKIMVPKSLHKWL